MSLSDEVKRLVAETGDGLLNAVHFLAGEVEKIGGVSDGASLAKSFDTLATNLANAVDAKLEAMVADARGAFEAAIARTGELNEQLKAVIANAPKPAAAPAAPAEQVAGQVQQSENPVGEAAKPAAPAPATGAAATA